jgi:hypothetical protein
LRWRTKLIIVIKRTTTIKEEVADIDMLVSTYGKIAERKIPNNCMAKYLGKDD